MCKSVIYYDLLSALLDSGMTSESLPKDFSLNHIHVGVMFFCEGVSFFNCH